MDALQWIFSTGINIREATQLNNELDCLRTTVPKARFLISRGEWGMFKNKELAKLLSVLKDTTYDAEDLLREFEDQVLRQKIEDSGRSRAGQLLSCSLNLAQQFIYGSKTRVKETQYKIDKAVAEIEGMLNFMGLNVEPIRLMPETSSVISAPEVFGRDSERDAVIEMLGVTIGREDERDQVIKLLGVPLTEGSRSASSSKGKKTVASNGVVSTSRAKRQKRNRSSVGLAETNQINNVSVVAIVGIGGVGKTTLAQLIYNDPRVQVHFGARIWVCVSDFFDKRKIMKEIIDSVSDEELNSSYSLNALQLRLMEQLKRHKFLLVLDDIWPNANDDWEAFYAPFRHGPEGSMILVTTRYPNVADLVTTSNCKPVQLEGLPTNVFWEFFKKCAFGKNDPESYPHLQYICRNISSRLCGSPLAAKTLGRLLNMELTGRHWRTIQNSELWELPHQENEILPALQLTYLYLPPELKRCFAFCSMFPKDHSFEREEIIDIWVAQRFIAPTGSMRLEDIGIRYLDDLRSRFLFQSDPKFPNKARYVMHDLIHDMAQSVSVDECLLIQDLGYLQNWERMPHAVRHVSVMVEGETLSRMRDMQHLNKLHSLRFGTRLDVEVTWFSQLSNILLLSLRGCKLVKLPESLGELNSLRYLDISHSSVQELPKKLWRLYSLQVLDANRSRLKTIDQDVRMLINLRQLVLPAEASLALSRISGLGNMSCLQKLKQFTVGQEYGRRIGELKDMNQLSGTLSIRSLHYVEGKEEAAEARLVDKQYLTELYLYWPGYAGRSTRFTQNGVVEGLHPHSGIERLKVHGFWGDRFSPSWFNPENLPVLRSLELLRCSCLQSLSIPKFASLEQLVLNGLGLAQSGCITIAPNGLLPLSADSGTDRKQNASSSASRSKGIASFAFLRLTALHIANCTYLRNLDQFLTPENLPSIKSIWLHNCCNLESIPVHSFVGFICLEDLKISWCYYKLECSREMVLPPSLRRLSIVRSNELDKSFPACLQSFTSLTLLQLMKCDNVRSIPLNSIASANMLKCLVLRNCPELVSIGGSQSFSSIQHVQISDCPKLTEVEQPFEKEELRTKEDKGLLKFVYYGF
ncbi:unnamed protein product [Urochloa decumbens]|uniref:NB-ARC domain-containing protein n=1 Tax=Urochloa decumbens TaxID=240449 RepID=A0ABC9G8X5_9POAL